MNVIFVGRKSGSVKQFDLRHPVVIAAAYVFPANIKDKNIKKIFLVCFFAANYTNSN